MVTWSWLLTTGSKDDDDIVSDSPFGDWEKRKEGDCSDDDEDTQILQPDRREFVAVAAVG
jgi:hypothetical protein